MFRVFTCLTGEHDWRLVLLAGLICFLASFAAVSLLRRAIATRGRGRAVWLAVASAATGCGIWATHFIAMLAYEPGIAVGYQLGFTILSLVAAMAVTAVGLSVAVREPSHLAAPLGGAIVGAGVAAMHYTGMAALELPGHVTWAPGLVTASIALGLAFGAAALRIALRSDQLHHAMAAAVLLTLAIVSHHFTAMGAVIIVPDPTQPIGHLVLSPQMVALAVAGAAAAVLGMAIIAGFGDRRSTTLVAAKNVLLDAAMNNMVQGLNMFDGDGRLVLSNARYIEMYGLSPDVVKPGCTIRDMVEHRIARGSFFSDDPERYIAELMAALKSRTPSQRTLDLPDGRVVSVINQPMANGGWVVTHTDITKSSRAKQELERTRNFLDTVIEHVPAAILVRDAHDRRYRLINRATEQLYGIRREAVIGRTAPEIFPDLDHARIAEHDRQSLSTRRPLFFDEHPARTPGNGTRIVTKTTLPVMDQAGEPQYLVTVVQDVTDRKRAEARAERLAYHDPLTDLPNRAAFTQCFDRMIERAAAERKTFAVLSIDLDRFKDVNDVFGHPVGDALLQAVAQRLATAAAGAFLARHGDDEFAMIVDDDELLASLAADRLQTAVADKFEIEGHSIGVGLSVGIALYPVDGADATTLIANADAALYRAKSEGRGATRFFKADADQRVRERRALVHDLRSAIERGELTLYYQPQARIDGEIVGFEALARWHHPTRGNVTPDVFIPLAEECGLIVEMGEWILREACREAASWPKPLNIAVNLSPVQFQHGDLASFMHALLLETGLDPRRLEVEITEGVLIGDLPRALTILRRLKLLGVRFAMDDFGTGYSSLSNLQAFPFDKIKIDRSFVSNLEKNPQSATIVRAVIGLGRGLGLPIIAEGVETQEQLTLLRAETCNEVQGYFIGRPLPIDAYAEVVGRTSKLRHVPAAVA